MRRSASEVIKNLEQRIARLEEVRKVAKLNSSTQEQLSAILGSACQGSGSEVVGSSTRLKSRNGYAMVVKCQLPNRKSFFMCVTNDDIGQMTGYTYEIQGIFSTFKEAESACMALSV